jgi:hypothetical protein
MFSKHKGYEDIRGGGGGGGWQSGGGGGGGDGECVMYGSRRRAMSSFSFFSLAISI